MWLPFMIQYHAWTVPCQALMGCT
uniref:Uncharacterized protein n=1 Tax=Arundo donax TaxID=35708 RepID=A0A0A9EM82_ARUDO